MRFGDLVLYNDHQVIACTKPAGMPTQEDKTGDASLHRLAQAYCKKDLFLVHRLDRPCSGLVIFAKNKNAAALLSAQFADKSAHKQYLAVVPKGIPAEGTLIGYVTKTGSGKVRVTETESPGSKIAELHYKTTGEIDKYCLLTVVPQTGRLHQIRAQLGNAGYPIKGDVKYGSRRGNKDRSINLHSRTIAFKHPTKNQEVVLTSPLPDESVWNAFELS